MNRFSNTMVAMVSLITLLAGFSKVNAQGKPSRAVPVHGRAASMPTLPGSFKGLERPTVHPTFRGTMPTRPVTATPRLPGTMPVHHGHDKGDLERLGRLQRERRGAVRELGNDFSKVAAEVEAASDGEALPRTYTVFSRTNPTDAWTNRGTYGSVDEATEVADTFQNTFGYEVVIR
jgi:hypothetical protein